MVVHRPPDYAATMVCWGHVAGAVAAVSTDGGRRALPKVVHHPKHTKGRRRGVRG